MAPSNTAISNGLHFSITEGRRTGQSSTPSVLGCSSGYSPCHPARREEGGRVTGKWWRGWSRCHDPRHLLVIVAVRSEGHARGHHVSHQTHVILRLLARSPSLRLCLGFNALVLSLGAQQRHPWPRGICGIAAVFHGLQSAPPRIAGHVAVSAMWDFTSWSRRGAAT